MCRFMHVTLYVHVCMSSSDDLIKKELEENKKKRTKKKLNCSSLYPKKMISNASCCGILFIFRVENHFKQRFDLVNVMFRLDDDAKL